MAFYGPKKTDSNGDTLYYSLPPEALRIGTISQTETIDSAGAKTTVSSFEQDKSISDNEAFIVLFVRDEEKLNGLVEYAQYKKEKLDNIRIFLVRDSLSPAGKDVLKVLAEKETIKQLSSDPMAGTFEEMRKYYFVGKPVHVFDFFAVLVDKDKHIRGFYDATFIAEVKRMIEEYKHLVLKDEHADMQDKNKIEKN